ncbi:THAP domain containing 12a [Denticeps clupeoides]|uniref:THAP-type domain-containing protein n=1 Tax=Denticeps clupeoides TaxID=299321 RepID=A0AAY4AHY4_9TELE|nr:52 kDa repressor of the inhibitor of the protein kinase [Denticeps clupeoides]XP_028839572.1 52 kDa repressor of the inhibitor of the protein kinase [Denticeps clupeoides]
MPNFCIAPNCTRRSTQSDLAFFRFPRDTERCNIWVENCRRADLVDKTPDQLNKHYRLCANHFEPSMICKTSPYRTVLRENAIPTIFDFTSHLKNPPTRHRKRVKVLTEEEVRDIKERRLEASDLSKKNKDEEIIENQEDAEPPIPELSEEEKEHREYLKSLFEILTMMGRQNIPLNGHSDEEEGNGPFIPSNFQALLEYRINTGDEILRKKFDGSAVNSEYCSTTQLGQMLDVCEAYVCEELLQEVKDCRLFSLIADDVVQICTESYLPLLVRFVDQENNPREEFVGFLSFDGSEETVTERLLTTVSEKWGLDMGNCRGQSYLSSGVYARKIKAIATCLVEKYPLAVHTPCSNAPLNIFLANSMGLTGTQLVMTTLKKIEAFFSNSPPLVSELTHAISIYYQGNEEKANDLKELCCTNWTERHDSFELAVDFLESLLLCMDSVHDNEDLKWNDQITQDAFVISEALADFEFVVTLVVLKNTLSFTRAFGKNIQGRIIDVFFAATSLTAVLHSLNEVMDNIEVYHEFWFEEAVNMAAALEIPVKVPRLFFRKQRPELGVEIQPETYFKEHLTVPVVRHVIDELNDLFSENHLKALKSLSLVPSVMGQLKFNTAEETNADIYKDDLPNPDILAAELHCWRVKWKHRSKEVPLPVSMYETLQLSDVKFFPNVNAFLKVLCTLPVLTPEDGKCKAARKRLRAYLEDTPVNSRCKSLALFNINNDIRHDLDQMAEMYVKLYPESC